MKRKIVIAVILVVALLGGLTALAFAAYTPIKYSLEVRAWIDELGVTENYVAKDGSCVVYLD